MLCKEYGWTYEYVEELDAIKAMKLLLIIKQDKTEWWLKIGQVALLPNSGEAGWKAFLNLNEVVMQEEKDLINVAKESAEEYKLRAELLKAQFEA